MIVTYIPGLRVQDHSTYLQGSVTLRTLLSPKQAKKSSKIGKERAKKLTTLHKELCESAKMVQERIKLYYNRKRSEGPDLKKGDKI